MTDVEAEAHDPGRLLRTASLAVEVTILVGSAALYWSGVIGQVGFWRGLWAGTMLNLLHAVTTATRALRLNARLLAFVSDIEARPALRCAGCHTRVWLTHGSTADGFPVPPDWGMRNDRPYCPNCLDRD